MDEYTPYCAICGGPIEDPDVQSARIEMGDQISSTWLSEAILLRAETADFPDITIHQLPARNRGGPQFELSGTGEEVTTGDVSGSIVPSPKQLYIPCHAACTTIAEKVMTVRAERCQTRGDSSGSLPSIDELKWHMWHVLEARFEKASEGRFQPVTNFGLVNDYEGIGRFQGLAWEPGSDGILEAESQQFEADPLHIQNLTSSILSHLPPLTQAQYLLPSLKKLPCLWDLDVSTVAEEDRDGAEPHPAQINWDWGTLYKKLENNALWELDAPVGELPLGLRNRCRIWRLVEDLLMEDIDVTMPQYD